MAVQHKDIPREHMHDPYRWVVADEAERLAIAPLISDALKWAHQLSDDTIWELKNFDPVTWRQVSAVSSVHGRTGAVTAQTGDYTPAQVGADPAGAASTAVTSHEQAADPHSQYAQKADLAAVATSGNYNDLTNKPDLSVLEEVNVYADLASFPATGETNKVYIAQDIGYMYRWSGSGYVQLTDQTAIWGQISGDPANQSDLSNALAAKVDKVAGKGLSTNDYTDAEQTKLAGIEAGATKNATDAALRDRSTHTGTQPASTISDFDSQASAAAPVQAVDGQTGTVDLSGSYEAKRQNNLTATTDPAATDDASAGYEPMSRWINTSTGEIWLCVDDTTGAANWQKASLTLDELGSAAVVDVGTGQAQIPLNGDLGSAAYSDASEFDEAGAASDAVAGHETTYDHTAYDAAVLKQKREELLAEATLSLDFANNRYSVYEGPVNSLTQVPYTAALTHTRGTTATARNATGGISDVGIDEQRLVGNREGLLVEEQRTRLNTIAAAPTSAETVTVSAVAHTVSFYGSGSVALSGAFIDTLTGTADDERVTLTFTPTAGGLTITPSGTVTDLQLEEGSTASSVIRGEGSQVTRAADRVGRTLGAEFKASEGTILVYVKAFGGSAFSGVFSVGADTLNRAMDIAQSTAGTVALGVRVDGDYLIANASDSTSEGWYAIASKPGEHVAVANGAVIGQSSDPRNAISGSEIGIGRRPWDSAPTANSLIIEGYYFPRALTAEKLQILTAPEDAQ